MSMRMKLPGLGTTAALASALFLSGCAVMRIDVDVYKGPLANDEIVQLQQFQSMAPGMFEVMVQLRDQFEWGDLPVWQCEDGRAEMEYRTKTKFGKVAKKSAKCPPGYERRAMPSNAEFTHPNAVLVNETLSLFEDKQTSAAAKLATAVSDAIEEYQIALVTLDPSNSDLQQWERLERKMLKSEDFVEKANVTPASAKLVKQNFEEFKKRFRRLLDPFNTSCPNFDDGFCRWRTINIVPSNAGDRNHDGIAEAYEALRKSMGDKFVHPFIGTSEDVRLNGIVERIPNAFQSVTATASIFPNVARPTSVTVSSKRWIDHYADVLFGVSRLNEAKNSSEIPKEKDILVRTVWKISQSHARARLALRDLWKLSSDGLLRLPELGENDRQRKQLRKALASLLAVVTNPRRLTVAALNPKADQKARRTILLHMHPQRLLSYDIAKYELDDFDFETAYQNLKSALETDTQSTVQALLMLDEALIFDFNPMLLDGTGIKFRYQGEASLQYGVTRSLSAGPNQLLDASLPIQQEALTKAAGDSGLARGRPEKGVFSLVEDFIESERKRRRCSDQTCDQRTKRANIARDELTQGLIHFAQKVSSIANHDALLPDGGRPSSASKNTDAPNASVRIRSAFVPTLQAIGNTFLIQADELEARRRHTKKMNEQPLPERLALEYSLNRTPAQVVDDLILDLEARRDAIAANGSSAFTILADNKIKLAGHEDDLEGKKKKRARLQGQLDTLETALKAANGKAAPSIFAHRSLPNSEQLALNETFDSGEDTNRLKKDQEDFDKHLKADNTNISIDALKAHAVVWLQGQIVENFRDTPRQRRLTKTLAFFRSELNSFSGNEALVRDTAVKQLTDKIEKIYAEAKITVKKETKRRDDKKKEVEDSDDDIANLNTEIAGIVGQEVKKLNDTIKIVKARRRDVEIAAKWPNEDGDPPTVMRILRADIKGAAEKDKTDELQNAKMVLALYPIPSGQAEIAALPDRRHQSDRRDVLDHLISSLRYADIEAARSGQGARSRHFQAALKKAYEYRASMVYIRPASSYLRSSYAANSLQGDPTLGWRNMLTRHASRGLPYFIAQAINQDDPNTEAIRAELDKQFWQNINSVRVGGGGITNYALIKDDIGNWAIKSFSADPEPIIKAAQNLAMFNLGGSLDTNLLRVNELRAKPNRSDGEQEELNLLTERTSGGGPALKRLFEHHEQRYVEKTETQLKAFAAEVKGTTLQDRVKAAWTQSLQGEADDEAFRQSLLALPDSDDAINEANKTLAEAGSLAALAADDDAKELKKKRQERQKTAITMGEKMVAALGQVNGYRTKLQSEAGLIIGKKIEENRGKIAGASTEIQSIEKMIAEQETTEKNLVKAIADLKGLRPTDTGPEQKAFDSKLEELDSSLQALRTELATNRTSLTTQKSALSEAKTKLALREIQLKAISADANRIVGGLILEVTRGRQAAMASFEQAILFIGDTPDASGDPLLRVGQPQ